MVAIFVVLAILLLVGAVDIGLERRRKRQEIPEAGPGRVPEPGLPAGLFVHPGHTWAEILRSGQVRGEPMGGAGRVFVSGTEVLTDGDLTAALDDGGARQVRSPGEKRRQLR